jgi:hypothetical protein
LSARNSGNARVEGLALKDPLDSEFFVEVIAESLRDDVEELTEKRHAHIEDCRGIEGVIVADDHIPRIDHVVVPEAG